MMLSLRQLAPSWERWLRVNLKLDPLALFAGCLPSKPLASSGSIDWRKADGRKDHPVWAPASVPIETVPRKYDFVVLLALSPRDIMIRVFLFGNQFHYPLHRGEDPLWPEGRRRKARAVR